MGRLFRIMDDDNSNSLTYADMKKGLNDYGVPLDSEAEYK